MAESSTSLEDLNERSRVIFRQLVETYLATGEPVGSRTLARTSGMGLSPATIRNVMQDLEEMGLLGSPHVSAGRVPTQMGLRMFVDGVLEIGDISVAERTRIERSIAGHADDIGGMLDEAGTLLSGLSHCASLIYAPKLEAPIRHIEFIPLAHDRALAILVTADGQVENRLFHPPPGLTPAASLVERGVALWNEDQSGLPERLIIRGRANLLEPGQAEEEIERIRLLFDDLETKRDIAQLIDLAEQGDGVKVFIGSENKLFSLSGSSLVISPYTDARRRIIGAIGVIGPTRLNYGRIVPIVDYTARLVGRVLAGDGGAKQAKERLGK
jgi:heat-inducible transcriptional repressor